MLKNQRPSSHHFSPVKGIGRGSGLFSVIALAVGTSVSLLLAELVVRLFDPQTLTSDVVEWDPDG